MADDYGVTPHGVHADQRTANLSPEEAFFLESLIAKAADPGLFNGHPKKAAIEYWGGMDEAIIIKYWARLEEEGLICFYTARVPGENGGPGYTVRVGEVNGWNRYAHNERRLNPNRWTKCPWPYRDGTFPKYRKGPGRPKKGGDVPTQNATMDGLNNDGWQGNGSGMAAPWQVSATRVENRAGSAALAAPSGAAIAPPSAGPTAGALDGPPRGSSPSPEPNPNPKPKHRPRLTKAEIDALPGLEKARYHVERRAMREWRERQGQRGEEDSATEAETVAGPGFVVGTAAWDPEPKGGRWVRYDASPGELAWRPWQPGEPGYVAPPVEAKPPEPTPEELAAEQARIAAEREARAKADAERKEAERVKAEADEAKRKADMAERADMIARARVSFAKMAAEDDASKLPWPSEALEARCAAMIASFARLGAQKPSVVSRTIGDLMAKAGLDVANRALDRLDAMGQAWEGWRKQDPWDPVTKLLADAAKPVLAPVPDP